MKKFLAGILCLLMVITMVPAVFAESHDEAHTADASITTSMIDTCPKCNKANAFFNIAYGTVTFYCPSCKASGTILESTPNCLCGNDCDCIIPCDSCGRYVYCGVKCTSCKTVTTCGKSCTDCWFTGYYSHCDCGIYCDCIILCDCGRFVNCGTRCPNCMRYNFCEEDCAQCDSPECECECGADCDAIVQCDRCGTYTICGIACRYCLKYVYCGENCKQCDPSETEAPETAPKPEVKPEVKPDYFYNCICGRFCSCPVKCTRCGTIDFCGEFCDGCGTYLNCGIFCNSCYNYNWYPIYYNCTCGTSCTCVVPCRYCFNTEAGFCGEKCSTCGNVLKCYANCKTCGTDTVTTNKVTVTKNYGGTYELSNGIYGTEKETKILTVTPFRGYDIYDVTINGVSHGDSNKFELKMDRSYVISITFARLGFARQYTIDATVIAGSGTIQATRNNVILDVPAHTTAAHKDTLYYSFAPAENYYLKDVKINGVSMGAITLYCFQNIITDATVEVVFGWKNPYTDIPEEHLAAVEYATEAKLMTHFYPNRMKHIFKGENNTTLGNLVTALAEMADVKNELETDEARINWAVANGLIVEGTKTTAYISAQTACDIVAKFLEVMKNTYKVTFDDFSEESTAKDFAIGLKLVTEKTYTANNKLTRFDLAELLLALSNISFTKAQ